MITQIKNLAQNTDNNFFLIAGPCIIEDEETVKKYIKKQEEADRKDDQLKLF